MTYDIVFVAGVLSFFSPCIIPLLPIYIAQFAKGASEIATHPVSPLNGRLIAQAIVFVSGISTAFVLLGFGAGLLGQALSSETFLTICGLFAIVMGVYKMGLLRMNFLARERKIHMKKSPRSGVLSAYVLGFTFSFGWTPCIGPVLATVLGVASSQGLGLYGALLMLIYSMGLAIPFVVISVMGNVILDRIKVLNPYLGKFEVVSGALIVLMGILLITNHLNILVAV